MNSFKLNVSDEKVRSKEEGRYVTNYELMELDYEDEEKIKQILTGRNYSTNVWAGSRCGMNYMGMTGVALDIDGGMCIAEAKRLFAGYRYIVHTSSSHQVAKDGIVAERFRIILPFAPSEVLHFKTMVEFKKVYTKLLYTYPAMDPACIDAGRQFFPFTPTKGASFELYVNSSGKYFDIDISDISDQEVGPDFEVKEWDGELRPKNELDRVLKFCPFIRWMDEHIEDSTTEMHEPLRFALISNLCLFEGGDAEIHRILSRDCRRDKYSVDLIDDKISRCREQYSPQTYARISKLGWPGKIPVKPLSPAGWGKIGVRKRGEHVFLGWHDKLIVGRNHEWEICSISSLKKGQSENWDAVCPVCDSDRARIKKDAIGFICIHCDNCSKDYFESALHPGMFTYKNKLLRVECRSGKFISMEVMEEAHFRTKPDFVFAKCKIFNDPERKFLDHNFQVRQMGNAEYDYLGYEFDIKDNALLYKFPALPADIQDNEFINRFLNGLFGQYSGFIKDWMAMYCYTNYITLPVIVLTGERSCGKGTFANMVGSIFPTLAAQWDGSKETFNDQYKSKLLFVDENPNAEKPVQYTEIKKITGNKILRINEKYTPAYYVPNNVNIIIATNDPRPIFLRAREEPKTENTNNFFIYRLPDLNPKLINDQLANQLEKRLGHYVRTELRERYDRLKLKQSSNNRYALPAPITQLEKNLFAASPSIVELETEDLAYRLVCGVSLPYPDDDFELAEYGGATYVKLADIRLLMNKLGFKGSQNPKAYINLLQDHKVISYDTTRINTKWLGYKILRGLDYYTTASGEAVMEVTNEGTEKG